MVPLGRVTWLTPLGGSLVGVVGLGGRITFESYGTRKDGIKIPRGSAAPGPLTQFTSGLGWHGLLKTNKQQNFGTRMRSVPSFL